MSYSRLPYRPGDAPPKQDGPRDVRVIPFTPSGAWRPKFYLTLNGQPVTNARGKRRTFTTRAGADAAKEKIEHGGR